MGILCDGPTQSSIESIKIYIQQFSKDTVNQLETLTSQFLLLQEYHHKGKALLFVNNLNPCITRFSFTCNFVKLKCFIMYFPLIPFVKPANVKLSICIMTILHVKKRDFTEVY